VGRGSVKSNRGGGVGRVYDLATRAEKGRRLMGKGQMRASQYLISCCMAAAGGAKETSRCRKKHWWTVARHDSNRGGREFTGGGHLGKTKPFGPQIDMTSHTRNKTKGFIYTEGTKTGEKRGPLWRGIRKPRGGKNPNPGWGGPHMNTVVQGGVPARLSAPAPT